MRRRSSRGATTLLVGWAKALALPIFRTRVLVRRAHQTASMQAAQPLVGTAYDRRYDTGRLCHRLCPPYDSYRARPRCIAFRIASIGGQEHPHCNSNDMSDVRLGWQIAGIEEEPFENSGATRIEELGRRDLAVINGQIAIGDLSLEIAAEHRHPDRRARIVEHLANRRHALRNADHRAYRPHQARLA